MDRQTNTEELGILDQALATLEDQGLDVTVRPHAPADRQGGADAVVRVRYGNLRIEFRARIKRNLRPATLGAILHQLRAVGDRPLLITDHATPPMAERLRKAGMEFVDTAGNAYLNEPPMLVWITGQRTATGKTPRVTGRAFQASGLRVLFALLCKPKIVAEPYRRIAKVAGVAHGTVGWVMAEMPELGYVAEYRKRRVLVQPERLLADWAEAYARALRPKCLLGRFRAEKFTWWKNLDFREYDLTVGGEAAAAQMTRHLRPEMLTFYTNRINQKFIARFKLRKNNRANVEILEKFWAFDDKAPVAPEPLVYADLLATGNTRCIETAEKIYPKIIDGFKHA